MPRFQVVVTDYLAEAGPEKKILNEVADIRLLQTHDENDVARLGADADVLLVYHDIKLTERSISAMTKCRGIVRCGDSTTSISSLRLAVGWSCAMFPITAPRRLRIIR
ncbi:MAG: hypothetical protein U0744_06975 [Gemmataceae bacterium]